MRKKITYKICPFNYWACWNEKNIMKTILQLLLLFFIPTLSAQVGKPFPAMETESLTNKLINIPEGLKGKYSLLGLAFSKKAEDNLKTWLNPVWHQFIRKPSKMDLFATNYDINLYFIPMFSGHKTVIYKTVMSKVQKTTDPKLHQHILFYKGSLKMYKEALSFKEKKIPYFYLLDTTGKIVWQTNGIYSDQKMQEVVDHLDEALGSWD